MNKNLKVETYTVHTSYLMGVAFYAVCNGGHRTSETTKKLLNTNSNPYHIFSFKSAPITGLEMKRYSRRQQTEITITCQSGVTNPMVISNSSVVQNVAFRDNNWLVKYNYIYKQLLECEWMDKIKVRNIVNDYSTRHSNQHFFSVGFYIHTSNGWFEQALDNLHRIDNTIPDKLEEWATICENGLNGHEQAKMIAEMAK